MPVDKLLQKCRGETRSRAARMLMAVGAALALCLPLGAMAQTTTYCGPDVKEYVAKTLAGVENASQQEKLAVEAELYAKYKTCLKDAALVVPTSTFFTAARQCGAGVSQLGSIFFEEMTCCGYDPQRRQFACPVKIKQVFGYGAAQLPGSREHVLHCVFDTAAGTYVPVGHDSVHLANSIAGAPTWQFAVIANANQNLHTVQPMNGQVRQARSILSWAMTPTSCNYQPIWGNALNYRIRLDQ
jgi:hypothetical protein